MRFYRGFTLIELTAAGAILATLVAVLIPLFAAIAGQRQSLRVRQAAAQEAANVMERLACLSWEDLTAREVDAARLSAEAQQVLPGGELKVEMTQPRGQTGSETTHGGNPLAAEPSRPVANGAAGGLEI